jgi:hypothetical protein
LFAGPLACGEGGAAVERRSHDRLHSDDDPGAGRPVAASDRGGRSHPLHSRGQVPAHPTHGAGHRLHDAVGLEHREELLTASGVGRQMQCGDRGRDLEDLRVEETNDLTDVDQVAGRGPQADNMDRRS